MRTPVYQANQRLFANTPSDLGNPKANVQNIMRNEMFVASALYPHQVDPTADLTVTVEEGNNVGVGGSAINFAGGSSPTFTPPGSGSRVDLLVLSVVGVLEIQTGISGPSNYPADKRPIAEVTLTAGQTQILDANIKDVRQFLGGIVNPNQVLVTSKLGTAADDAPVNKIFSVASGSYTIGIDEIRVHVDGILQTLTSDYTESSTTTITLVSPVLDTQIVTLIVNDIAGFSLTTRVAKAGDTMTGNLTLPQLNVGSGAVNLQFDGSDNLIFTDAFNSINLAALVAGLTVTTDHEEFTASGGETLINLAFSYIQASSELQVFLDGVLFRLTDDYTETSTTSITMVVPLTVGQKLTVHQVT